MSTHWCETNQSTLGLQQLLSPARPRAREPRSPLRHRCGGKGRGERCGWASQPLPLLKPRPWPRRFSGCGGGPHTVVPEGRGRARGGAGRPGSREPERCKRSVCPPEVLPAGNPQNRALEGVRARNCFAVSQQWRSGWPSWFNNQSFTERLSLSKLAELIGGAIRVQKGGHIDRLAKSGLSYRESK